MKFLLICLSAVLNFALQASTQEKVVFYMEKIENGCNWYFADSKDFKAKKMHQSRECHRNILFHKTKKNIVYLDKQDILVWDMAQGTTPKKIGTIPKIKKELFGKLVITKDNSFRISRYIPIKENKILLKDNKKIITYKNIEYEEYDLPWGISALAQVLEFKDNKWQSIYITATKYSDSDTPGFSLVRTKMKSSDEYNSLDNLLKNSFCKEKECFKLANSLYTVWINITD